jgi:hypothetical protein
MARTWLVCIKRKVEVVSKKKLKKKKKKKTFPPLMYYMKTPEATQYISPVIRIPPNSMQTLMINESITITDQRRCTLQSSQTAPKV